MTLPAFIETFPETAGGFGSAQSLLVAICEFMNIHTFSGRDTDQADLVGCFFGALLNLYVGDWLGRKKTMYM